MKKIIWISFITSLVLVNLVAWLVTYFTGFYILMIHRLTLVLGILLITIIFTGASALISKLDGEKPQS